MNKGQDLINAFASPQLSEKTTEVIDVTKLSLPELGTRNVSRIREREVQAGGRASEREERRELEMEVRGRTSGVKKSRQPPGKLQDLSGPGP